MTNHLTEQPSRWSGSVDRHLAVKMVAWVPRLPEACDGHTLLALTEEGLVGTLFPSLTCCLPCCWALPCLFLNSPIKSNSMAVGDHETYFGEQITGMPLELVDHAALILPAVRLVLEVLADAFDPSLRESPNPTCQPISDLHLQHGTFGQTDPRSDVVN